MFIKIGRKELPLFKKDLKDFFGPKKILFFRLKYLKVEKKSFQISQDFALNALNLEKKSFFRDEISHVLNTLNRLKKSFLKKARAARNFFQYISHFLNDFLRKRRAQREIFSIYQSKMVGCRLACRAKTLEAQNVFLLFPCRCLNTLKPRKKSYLCFFASEKKSLKNPFFQSEKKSLKKIKSFS